MQQTFHNNFCFFQSYYHCYELLFVPQKLTPVLFSITFLVIYFRVYFSLNIFVFLFTSLPFPPLSSPPLSFPSLSLLPLPLSSSPPFLPLPPFFSHRNPTQSTPTWSPCLSIRRKVINTRTWETSSLLTSSNLPTRSPLAWSVSFA